MSDWVRAPESCCLNCGARMNALGTGDQAVEARPHPGDVAVCIQCGAVMKLDDSLRLRIMTDEERDALLADREWMAEVRRMVRSVHILRHTVG